MKKGERTFLHLKWEGDHIYVEAEVIEAYEDGTVDLMIIPCERFPHKSMVVYRAEPEHRARQKTGKKMALATRKTGQRNVVLDRQIPFASDSVKYRLN